jgi:predicted ribosome quality control (RQC) complex YloA/Tae2 family protein
MTEERDKPAQPDERSSARRDQRERLRSERAAAELELRRAALLRGLRRASAKTERKLTAIEGDARRGDQVANLRRHASLVLVHLHALPRGCTEVSLLDESLDPPEQVALHIDPSLGPKRQVEAWFSRARKLERGVAIAEARALATRRELEKLGTLARGIENATDAAQLDPLAEQARLLGVGGAAGTPPSGRRQPAERQAYREFQGSGERTILVGRGAQDNDRLTLDHARPHDLWLHARDHGGAHVVVPLARNEACPPELLGDAATLAAHFSQARGQTPVEVIYTPRRFVRKPRGSALGSVSLLRERVFLLRLDAERLRRLLASERPILR